MSLTLRGVYADTLGGFPVIRGFAKLSEIAVSSFADNYQRDLKPKHQQDIQDFYQRGEYLFFPELVLSLELLVDYDKKGALSSDPLQLLRQGQVFTSNVNGVQIKPTKTKAAADLARVNITLPDAAGKVLKRIDGNHRISAFEAMADKEKLDRSLVSFCILLLPQGKSQQIEKALFYNINSKALPLTSEEVYKGIVEDETGFPDDVLERDFGAEFVLCRQTRKMLDFAYLLNLRAVFGQSVGARDSRCSVLIEALRDWQGERQRLALDTALPSSGVLLAAIQRINASYTSPHFTASCSAGLFSAFLFFALTATCETGSSKRYEQFETWVLKNHQYELQRINATDLIRIFEKVAQSRSRQVFVSMQFNINGAPNENWAAIESAITDLNRDHHLDISLVPIRVDRFDKGFSYEINDEILRLIEDSGLLIADLTCGNKNVYHEIGYLMGLNQGKGFSHENFILLLNESIGDAKTDVGFNLVNIKQLRVKDTNTLRESVRKQVGIYYGLTGI